MVLWALRAPRRFAASLPGLAFGECRAAHDAKREEAGALGDFTKALVGNWRTWLRCGSIARSMPPAWEPTRIFAWVLPVGIGLRAALRWVAEHSGLPVVVVAAVALVASWHAFRRALRLAVEVAIAVAALVAATRLGWISW
jgi:hypothetical protein